MWGAAGIATSLCAATRLHSARLMATLNAVNSNGQQSQRNDVLYFVHFHHFPCKETRQDFVLRSVWIVAQPRSGLLSQPHRPFLYLHTMPSLLSKFSLPSGE